MAHMEEQFLHGSSTVGLAATHRRGASVEVNENSLAVVVAKEVKGKGPYSKGAELVFGDGPLLLLIYLF